MDRELLEDKVRAKARLAVRLRARDRKHSSSQSNLNGTGTKVDELDEDDETCRFGFCDGEDVDNDDDCNDNCNSDFQSSSSPILLPLPPPLSSMNQTIQLPLTPSEKKEKYMIQKEVIRNTDSNNSNTDNSNENLIENSSFAVENNENKDTNIVCETDPFICVPQLLHEFLPKNQSQQSLENLFVTHAQYKFVYKFACEFNKKK